VISNSHSVDFGFFNRARLAGFTDKDGEFRFPLLLLAIICGSPKSAEVFFYYLSSQKADDITLLKALQQAEENSDTQDWQALCSTLITFAHKEKTIHVRQLKPWIADTARFSYREWSNF